MATRFRGTPDQVRALDLFIKLTRAAESIQSRLYKPILEVGLTMSQFAVLEALYHLGPMCQRDLAGKILKSTGNMTLVIDNLEKQGLVDRVRDKKDRRMFSVDLRQEGRELLTSLFPDHVVRITDAFSVLDDNESKVLNDLLRKVGKPSEPM